MITLSPVRDPSEEWDGIERKIIELFKREIYLPLLKEFHESSKVLKNAKNDLVDALNSGRITFNRGVFSGRFNSSISGALKDLGASWDRKSSTWRLPLREVPLELHSVIAASHSKFKEKIAKIDKHLGEIIPEELASKLKVEKMFDQALWKTDKDFRSSVKQVSLIPELTPERRMQIATAWQQNMDLWIKNWTEEKIISLREAMQKSVFASNRFESAISGIQKDFQTTRSKAKFLARQETKLLVTTFKEIRYQEAGVDEYKWKSVKGSPAHPVRPYHKALNDRSEKGEIFRFSNPPVTDKSGRRNNPGQDYNCRCVAVPVVRFK